MPTINHTVKPSDVLFEAAKLMARSLSLPQNKRYGHGGCNAISAAATNLQASDDVNGCAHAYFGSLFRPEPHRSVFWFGGHFSKQEQEHRLQALLLTATMAEGAGV